MNQKWWNYGLSILLIIVSCVVGCAHPHGSTPETYSEPYADPAAGRMMLSPDSGGSGSSHEAPSHTPKQAPRLMPQGSGAR